MTVHKHTHNNFGTQFLCLLLCLQSSWYSVSETPPDFEVGYNFTLDNKISVNKLHSQTCPCKISRKLK